jgi:hypothetical protein
MTRDHYLTLNNPVSHHLPGDPTPLADPALSQGEEG